MPIPPIIVTDHDPERLELYQDILETEGYAPVISLGHLEAWQHTLTEPPRLMVIDIQQHDPAPAWALLDKLRLHDHMADIPVILCATNEQMHDAKDVQRVNCRILEKPFVVEDLLSVLGTLIGPPAPEATN